MRAFRKASVFGSLITLHLGVAELAQGADYVATSVGPDVRLRNNNGTLVSVKTISPDSPDHFTAITVSRGGKPTFLYVSPPGSTYSPTAINDAEVVVGSRTPNGGTSHAVILAEGAVTDIHSVLASAFGMDSTLSTSNATDINDVGEVVGSIWNSANAYAFKYRNGTVTDLGAIAGTALTVATAINNQGQILVAAPGLQAGIYTQGTVKTLSYTRNSQPSVPSITSYAINDAGQVVGKLTYPYDYLPPDLHGFFYDGVTVQDFGEIGLSVSKNPADINYVGTAVGTTYYKHSSPLAFIYRNGTKTDLSSITDTSSLQGRIIVDALSIGDDGAILATAYSNIPVVLTPTSPVAFDPAVFNFESGMQGWQSSGESIISVQTSTARKFAGEKSLGIRFNQSGFAAVSVANPSVKPGDTISFRVYLPADSKIDWIQPYALGGAADEWSWNGNWTPVGNLVLGAWNTLTVSIPADSHPLYSIGLEIFASQPNPGTVYLDSVDYGWTQDTAQYSFETGTQNWQSDGDPILAVASTAAQQFAGRKSLSLDVNGIGLARASIENPGVQPGATVTFHVFIPEGTLLESVQPFALEGAAGGWAWHGNWQPVSALQAGAWNSISVNVPAEAHDIAAIGIELATSQTNPGTSNHGTVFVDSVTF